MLTDHTFRQSIMSHEVQGSSPSPPTILHLLSDYFDLVMSLAEVMKTMQAYGSLAAFSSINREYRGMLQPYLKRTKKRIVLKMSKLEYLPQERFKDIEYVSEMAEWSSVLAVCAHSFPIRIIECSSESVLSSDITTAGVRALSRHAAGLQPWLLTFRGPAKMYLPDLQDRWFPNVEVLRLVVDESRKTAEELLGPQHHHYYDSDCCDPEWEVLNHYLDCFLVESADSDYATTFRFQAMTPSIRTFKHRFLYEVDMVSCSGKALQYRREYTTDGTAIHNVFYDQVDPNEWETHGVRSWIVKCDVCAELTLHARIEV
jgi:hypothetical protein